MQIAYVSILSLCLSIINLLFIIDQVYLRYLFFQLLIPILSRYILTLKQQCQGKKNAYDVNEKSDVYLELPMVRDNFYLFT